MGLSRVFSVRTSPDLYELLDNFAHTNRLTVAAAIVHFIKSGLDAESGNPYVTLREAMSEAE
jgi:hypothetical protein